MTATFSATRMWAGGTGLGLVVSLAACQEPTSGAPVPLAPSALQVALDCRVSVEPYTLTCPPAPRANPVLSSGVNASLIIGGQNLYVTLASPAGIYDAGSGVLASSVTIKNLLAQALGTSDGTTPDAAGVRVFFHTLPVVTGGTGTVSVRNADGTGTFTANGQPYFTYLEIIPGNGTSYAKSWQFNVPPTVTSFSFQVYVQATLRDEKTPLSRQPTHAFASNQFTGGDAFSCAIRPGAGVYCWGDNHYGQLGAGNASWPYPVFSVLAPALSQVTSGPSADHTCGLTSAGAAYCWGSSGYGQLGNGTTDQRLMPTPVTMPSGATFASLTGGGFHTCALTSAGAAYCWGSNGVGQLGDWTGTTRLTPTAVTMPSGVTFASLTAGRHHTCGLTSGGAAYCWGYNGYGQLGDGTTLNRLAPSVVAMPSGVTFVSLAGGSNHTCGLTSAGAGYCWGYNPDGQLGDGTTTTRLAPTAVTMPSGVTFASLAAGQTHTCGLTSAGAAYCWGSNSDGQLGDGTTTTRLMPTAVITPGGVTFASLTGGQHHTCGLTAAGAAYCWGDNGFGQLGDGTTTTRLTPIAVTMPGGVTFASLTVGQTHACGRTSAGAAYCWGGNVNGELGTTAGRRFEWPVPLLALNTQGVTSLGSARSGVQACALMPSGAAFCWGSGQLGDGTTTTRPTPTAVTMPGGVTFASLTGGGTHTCALTPAGAVYCWGYNNYGQLGDGTTTTRTTPAAVTMPSGVTFASLAAGPDHTCGLTIVGAAYCWGYSLFGQLGDGTTTPQRMTPTAVTMPSGVTFASLTAGGAHTCALTSAGAAYCWGINWDGQLGDGTTTPQRLTPTAVTMPSGVPFTSLTAGAEHTCGLTLVGAAYCWGNNFYGQLGDGTTASRSRTPTAVRMPSGVTFATLAGGSNHTCGLTSAGAAYCWGKNSSGQLGDGSTFPSRTPVAVRLP